MVTERVQNNTSRRLLSKLANKLASNNFIKEIVDTSKIFYDEPKIFSYSAIINMVLPEYKNPFGLSNQPLGGAGVSIISRERALLKCISEVIERISLVSQGEKDNIIDNFNNLKAALDPLEYKKIDNIGKKLFKWIEGKDLFTERTTYIPMQLIYLGYDLKEEVPLTIQISTGAAGGFDRETILLRGIYELIERDALMTTYLNGIKIKRIDLQSIRNKTIKSLVSTLEKYSLEILLFDITNDLEIPSFLSMLIDKTGTIGCPKMTVGFRSRLNIKEAIIGSIEEAFMGRTAERYKFYSTINKNKKSNTPQINSNLIDPKVDLLDKIKVLIYQKPSPLLFDIDTEVNEKKELDLVSKVLFRKKFNVYYADITLNLFKNLGHKVFKVVIPGLQPYLPARYEEYRIDRLKSVAAYFGSNQYLINKLPHPFI